MRPPVYALVGNPNCGKTTLFNALTGLNQRVGNYPGVTVEKHEGVVYSQHGQPLTLIDLPGAYSLAARSPDEAVLRDVLLGRRHDTPAPDRIICVVDASNLERSLYLISGGRSSSWSTWSISPPRRACACASAAWSRRSASP
jgi:ferrous iron transport protein B